MLKMGLDRYIKNAWSPIVVVPLIEALAFARLFGTDNAKPTPI